jgi:hypothetical protein
MADKVVDAELAYGTVVITSHVTQKESVRSESLKRVCVNRTLISLPAVNSTAYLQCLFWIPTCFFLVKLSEYR